MQKSSIRRFPFQFSGATALLSLTCGLAGCSASDTVIIEADPQAPSTPGTSPEVPDEATAQQYVISTRIFSTDLSTEVGYLTTTSSRRPGSPFDLEHAVEIPESGDAFPRPGDPWSN